LAIAETNFLVDKTAFIYCACGLENPPIMILDEATSALDTSEICSGRFRKHDAKQNFNCHRTPTLNHSKADVIVVMKRKNCRNRQ
jgi:ABC-type bacteriocin/lantibiotic exporter with double-glycine peptidase domain